MVLCPAPGNIIMEQNVLFVLRRVSSEVLGVLVLSALDNRYRMPSMHTKKTTFIASLSTLCTLGPLVCANM